MIPEEDHHQNEDQADSRLVWKRKLRLRNNHGQVYYSDSSDEDISDQNQIIQENQEESENEENQEKEEEEEGEGEEREGEEREGEEKVKERQPQIREPNKKHLIPMKHKVEAQDVSKMNNEDGGNSKREQIKFKKQRKKMSSLFVPPKNTESKKYRFKSCHQLRILLEKFSQQVSKSCNNYEQVISSDQIEELKKFLNQQSHLNIYEIFNQWIIDAMIVIIKEIKLWGLPSKYEKLQQLIIIKYDQIKEFVFSEEFNEIEISESKKKIIMLKLKTDKVNV